MTYAVLVYPTAITGVSLNGINNTVFDFLDNTGVVGLSVLRTRRTLVIPIKESNGGQGATSGIKKQVV